MDVDSAPTPVAKTPAVEPVPEGEIYIRSLDITSSPQIARDIRQIYRTRA